MELRSILIVEDTQGRREIVLDSSIYALGRDAKICNIHLAAQFVSRHHATLIRVPRDDETYDYRIVDGNLKKPSNNGLLINGRKLMAHDLKNEDEIIFGPEARAIYYQLKRDTTLPDEFGPDLSGSRDPRTPYPFTPSQGAEAIPE